MIAVLFVLGLIALGGCTQRESPSLLAPGGAQLSEAISPYTLVFVSRAYDSEADQTTFSYQLQNTTAPGTTPSGGVLAQLVTVMVELPSCAPAPASVSPPDGAQIYTNANGIYGVEWGVGYDDNPTFMYHITFPGDISSGTVRAMVATGGQRFISNVTGPCQNGYTITGTVFADANQDGVQEGNELGLSDVTVKLTGGESPQFATTDSDGNYTFTANTGSYTVSIDSLTAQTDFNEQLYQLWTATTPTSQPASVGPDASGISFGWEPNVDQIIALVDNGTYPTTGKSYKWWRKEFLRVLQGNSNTAYTGAQLLDFANEIKALALLDEYNFTPGHELEEIYDILNNHAFGDDDGSSIMLSTKVQDQGRHDAYAYLLRELLTTELNQVSGRGLADLHLQLMLINWGESVLNDNSPAAAVSPLRSVIGEPGDFPNLLTSPLEGAGSTFTKLNGATGGGGTN